MRIMLISGHGAGDPGCVATIDGVTYKEAEETRKVVDLLRPLLEPYAEVGVYDQERDAFKDAQAGSLSWRLQGWDYVLEIHFNACVGDYYGNGSTTGCEIFYPGASSGTEDAILQGLSALGLRSRGAYSKRFAVISTARGCGCMANLLEVCFLDDADDIRLYTADREAVAQAIAGGIVAAFGLQKEDDEEMTRYAYLKDIPNDWGARTMVDKLMTAGVIAGDGSDKAGNGDKIDLSADMVRMLAFNYAAGLYDTALQAVGLTR